LSDRLQPAAPSVTAALARGLLVLSGSALVYAVSAGGLVSSGRRLELLVAAVVVVGGCVWAAVVRPGWVPAILLLLASLTPYHLSFVGKTPFGVVTVTGALGTATIGVLLLRHGPGRLHVLRGPEVAALAAWVAVLTASALLGGDLRDGVNQVRLIAVAMPLAYVAGRLVADLDPRATRRVAAVAGVVAVLAILEQLTRFSLYDVVPSAGFPLEPPNRAVRSGLVRVRLGYYHGSTLGTVLAVAAPLVVLAVRRRGGAALRWVVPALLVALLFTVTFQVWVASAVALAILGVGLKRLRVSLVALVLATGVVVAAGAVPAVNELIDNRLNPTGSHADEYAYRAQLWPAAFRRAADGPLLGEGPGQFNQLGITGTVRNVPVRLVDDNTFTTSLVETGYPGVLALLLALGLVARRMLANPSREHAWAGLGALAAWMVMALSVEVLAGDQALLPCWLLLGMLSHHRTDETV